MKCRASCRIVVLPLFLGAFFLTLPLSASLTQFPPSKRIYRLQATSDFDHRVGKKGSQGWAVDHGEGAPGYMLSSAQSPLLLEPGTYRFSFHLRRGNYPNQGLFYKTFAVFRLEIWDITTKKLLATRELQMLDFPRANKYVDRWMEFSMEGRAGHMIEPRVFWPGLANGEIAYIDVIRTLDPDLNILEDKASRLGALLENNHIENGFVVTRSTDGKMRDPGDALTYTAFYVASLAWKYSVTQDEWTYQTLENRLQVLHQALKGTPDKPILVRYLDFEGNPFPKNPSKDVYMSVFYAYAIAVPFLKNPALKKQIEIDVERMGSRFLIDGLTVKVGKRSLLNLTPYFTKDEVRHGIDKFNRKPYRAKKIRRAIRKAREFLPLLDFWPAFKKALNALEHEDEDELIGLALPTVEALVEMADRIRLLLRDQSRNTIFGARFTYHDYPGRRLENLLSRILNKLPKKREGKRFHVLSDLKILASNALISLHIVKTAQGITKKPQFDEYYRTNLYTQDELLKTAIDWYRIEEEILRLTVGNPTADQHRKGYLSVLSLSNLIHTETNPTIKNSYQKLLDRWWKNVRHDDNPLAAALQVVFSDDPAPVKGLVLRGLSLYPENRAGFTNDYWKRKGHYVGERLGGGVLGQYSREPLPVSHRPKGTFLWQRNTRRLKGDHNLIYPPVDYLFLYWFARHHGILPETPERPSVKK